MKKITLAKADDWIGIYRDGELIFQGHSIDPSELLHLLGIEKESRWVDSEWIYQEGYLPKKLEDVRWEEVNDP